MMTLADMLLLLFRNVVELSYHKVALLNPKEVSKSFILKVSFTLYVSCIHFYLLPFIHSSYSYLYQRAYLEGYRRGYMPGTCLPPLTQYLPRRSPGDHMSFKRLSRVACRVFILDETGR